jgi:hypothetical protein
VPLNFLVGAFLSTAVALASHSGREKRETTTERSQKKSRERTLTLNAQSSFADAAADTLTRINLSTYPPRLRRKLEAKADISPVLARVQFSSSRLPEPTYLNLKHVSIR